jgi:hypothetical protein
MLAMKIDIPIHASYSLRKGYPRSGEANPHADAVNTNLIVRQNGSAIG